ncbi:DUF1707 SHOCT-like domain-containing protein [Amycolatopsis anabasis]|uniref:DUF1707 SHOCT-like domain-containing protein n=1 Tax=Amycolatopsis anabasis TaxID=1840409 RepID=UPI00131BC021|nr:DUF1707 domain-containing protein [Amycolatopsis anabasis]
MSTDRPDLRLSDAERQEAMDALSEHVRTGRLDIDEFGARSAKVSAAKRLSDLSPIFADLPAPRPAVLAEYAAARPARDTGSPRALSRLPSSAVPIAAIAGLILIFLVVRNIWVVAGLAVVAALVVGALSGGRRRR